MTKQERVKHRELQRGDIISLDFATPGWDRAKVTHINDEKITVFRPWMSASEDGYPTIGVEVFDLWRDSDKTVLLLERAEGKVVSRP